MKKEWSSFKKGFLLIEFAISLAFFTVLAVLGLRSLAGAFENSAQADVFNRALFLAQEGIEAVSNIRNGKFTNLTPGTHGLFLVKGRWKLQDTSDTIESFFRREITITDVDVDRKLAEVKISWPLPAPLYSTALKTRFVKWKYSLPKWSSPSPPKVKKTFNLTVGNSGKSNQKPRCIFLSSLYVGTDSNVGKEMIKIDDANIAESWYEDSDGDDPPLDVVWGLDLNGSPNDGVVGDDGRLYIISTDDGSELQVINDDDPAAPAVETTYNLTAAESGSDTADPVAIDIAGSKLVLAREKVVGGNEIFIFNVNPPPLFLQGQLNLDFQIKDLKIDGNYVYLATDDPNGEFKVLNISNPASPTVAAALNLMGAAPAISLGLNSAAKKVYLGRNGIMNPPDRELEVIDVTIPTAPVNLGGVDVGADDLNGIAVGVEADDDSDLIFTISSGSTKFRVFNVANPASPLLFSELPLGASPKGIANSVNDINSKIVIVDGEPEILVVGPELVGIEP